MKMSTVKQHAVGGEEVTCPRTGSCGSASGHTTAQLSSCFQKGLDLQIPCK